MPTIVVNGVTMEAKVGERLIDVARRNGAHVGFVCNGAGVCQTCQCKVLSGVENLSPVNPAEQAWFSENQLNEGQRLACKSALRGDGPVEISTKAEDLRRQVVAVINPPAGSNPVVQLVPLVQYVIQMGTNEISRFPSNAISAFSRVKPSDLTGLFKDFNRYLADTKRVVSTTRGASIPAHTPSRQVLEIETKG